MAEEPEHRMLFDLRGRRKRVIQVVYVGLALIMVLSLFTVVGPLNGLDLFGDSTNDTSANADPFLDEAARVEQKLKADPDNLALRVKLIRARTSAGNQLIEIDSDTGAQTFTPEAVTQYEMAAEAWDDYRVEAGKRVDPSVAQLMATTLFTLAQGSTVAQFEQNIASATDAQELVARNDPTAGTLTTLATYAYYGQEFERADRAREQALAQASTKIERNQIENQLKSIEQDAKRIGKQIAQIKKQSKGQGKQGLQEPAGSLGTGGASLGAP